MPTSFPAISFRGQLRPSQKDVVEIAQRELKQGKRHLHIVAPPGSGKTVLGLYLWAECVRAPMLVLSPNSAIQAQWAARTDLFEFAAPQTREQLVSTDPLAPRLLTSLTYQSITLPERGSVSLDEAAETLWIDRLVEAGQAEDPSEARVWIHDLKRHNRDYYEKRLGTYRKKVRDERILSGGALDELHESSRQTLARLREQNVGLIILDECHHLLGHWGRVLADARDFLEQPVVIGLTATPPDRTGKLPQDLKRYDDFFGPIDYEVPVPAVVKDGFLAPYQDLAYFVRPSPDELEFIGNADAALHRLVDDLCRPRETAANAARPDVAPLSAPAESGRAAESAVAIDARREEFPDGLAADAAQAAAALPAGEMEAESAAVAAGAPAVLDPAAPPAPPLPEWLFQALQEFRLPTGPVKDWHAFERRDPEFARTARLFLQHRGLDLPEGIPAPDAIDLEPGEYPEMDVLVPVLDRYLRHALRRSPHAGDQQLAVQAIARLRLLGVQITETGSQACASPVGRVMAYSGHKMTALLPILKAERASLGDRIRVVVVCDYEKTSAVTADVAHLLDDEAGGAVAAFKTLLAAPESDALDPVLLTGSSVLVDDDLGAKLLERCREWLKSRSIDVQLSLGEELGFHVLNGQGADWCPRVYVEMLTELFQQGVTRCLVGTRGLLGEGWDASKINVLIDLTTVTTSMSVNQLRGRSIRLDRDDPQKLANNWDVICVAPEFTKGLDDYRRLIRKHETLYGITEDGAIEKGIGHVHAALTELRPEGVEDSMSLINAEMLTRVAQRAEIRGKWKIGQPYQSEPVSSLEVKPGASLGTERQRGFPPFAGAKHPWNDRGLALAVGKAVLAALLEAKLIDRRHEIHIGERDGGYLRMFLKQAAEAESQLFAESLTEVFSPLDKPRYVIPRLVDVKHDTWASRWLPEMVGQFFRKTERQLALLHAVPAAFAKNKELAEMYAGHWNRHVSPGEALYAVRGPGLELLEEARRSGHVPRGRVHRKEIFV